MSTYTEGDKITIRGVRWVVNNVYSPPGATRTGVGLVDQDNPRHGTAFFSDVLDRMIADGDARRDPTNPVGIKVYAPERSEGMEHAVRAANGTIQLYSRTGLGIPGDTIPAGWVELNASH